MCCPLSVHFLSFLPGRRVSNVLQVARITSAELQPNSAKLLKLQADLGEEDQRQIMAGNERGVQASPEPCNSNSNMGFCGWGKVVWCVDWEYNS
jgi:hypothetical protein